MEQSFWLNNKNKNCRVRKVWSPPERSPGVWSPPEREFDKAKPCFRKDSNRLSMSGVAEQSSALWIEIEGKEIENE